MTPPAKNKLRDKTDYNFIFSKKVRILIQGIFFKFNVNSKIDYLRIMKTLESFSIMMLHNMHNMIYVCLYTSIHMYRNKFMHNYTYNRSKKLFSLERNLKFQNFRNKSNTYIQTLMIS